MLGVPRLRVDEDAVAVGLALQVVLGQRRPLVGTVGSVTDQDDPAVEALLAQGLRGHGAGQAAADDDEARFGGHE